MGSFHWLLIGGCAWPDYRCWQFVHFNGFHKYFPYPPYTNFSRGKCLIHTVTEGCIKYYANILTPFSPLVIKKINEILGFNLPLDMICPSHGIIWRDNPAQIVEKYLEWADNYQENQITILYDTMWDSTRIMAEQIAAGIRESDEQVTVKLFNLAKTDKNDAITEIFKSKAILMGSSTINNGILVHVAALLEEIQGLKFKKKKAGAFGSYGWSGEAAKIMLERLGKSGFDTIDEGLRVTWAPDNESKLVCRAYGKTFVAGL
jgi:anaerobic nitric oxide reductase flavorubredoxin